MPRWFEYTEALRDAGAMVAGDALEPTDGARTVRVRSGARQVTDGPVAETADVLGGYYVIDVADSERGGGVGGADPQRAVRLGRDPADHGVRRVRRQRERATGTIARWSTACTSRTPTRPTSCSSRIRSPC